jgi:hypothetical protein
MTNSHVETVRQLLRALVLGNNHKEIKITVLSDAT